MRNHPKSLFWGAAIGIALVLIAGSPAFSQIKESDGGLYKLRVVVPEAKLRLKPEANSLVITKLPLGAYFETKDRTGKYFRITLPSDKEGLVFIGYVISDDVEIEYVPLGVSIYAAPSVPASAIAYTDWRLKLDRAKSLRNGGFAFLGGGVVSFIIAAILGEDGSRGAKTATIVSGAVWSLAGCGMIIAGSQAASELEARGQELGYLVPRGGAPGDVPGLAVGAAMRGGMGGGGFRISYRFSF